MKFYLTEYSKKAFHAGSKATKDVNSILDSAGYHQIVFYNKYGNGLISRCLRFISWSLLNVFLSKDDTIFIQWPYYRIKPIDRLHSLLARKKVHIQLLIHDINSLRNFDAGYMENGFFTMADLVIAHTERMKDYLIANGVREDRVRVLHTFDYFTDEELSYERSNSNTLVFAGNLDKSTFLHNVATLKTDLTINCYGKRPQVELSHNLVYKTLFQPEHISILEGSWGLVWDGISLNGCHGDFGEYLRFNSPHKTSLYIVAGLPIIIWSGSALASYIVNNKLGIAVDSIADIPPIIASMSEETYKVFLNNVAEEADSLKKGKHLLSILEKGTN